MQHESISILVQSFLRITLFAIAGITPLAYSAEATFSDAQPVTLLNSVQYDFRSAITGRDYRLFVSAPDDAADKAYPVLYLLDGNRDFPALANRAPLERGVVVGIGYPLQDIRELRGRRVVELTPTVDASRDVPTGDSINFMRVLEEEIRPFIASRYRLMENNQALYGHSLGGLAVLGHMFRHPEAFNTFLIGSPSIWWDNRVVLADEAAFSARVKAGELKLRVLLMSAGDEQNCGEPELSAAAQADCAAARMVDNVTDLAARLQALHPANMPVTRTIFADETHDSSTRPSVGRAFRFVMPE